MTVQQYDFYGVVKNTSEMSSKNRNKIILFLQSQDSFPFVKFNFSEGNWELFSVWFFLFGFGFTFCSVHQGNWKAAPWDSGKTSLWVTLLAKKYCMVLFSQLLEPDMKVVLSLLHPASHEFWGCRRGQDISPQQIPSLIHAQWSRRDETEVFANKTSSNLPKNLLRIICNVYFFPPVGPFSAQIHAEQASPSHLKDLPNANWLLKTFTPGYKRCAALLAGTSKLLLRLLQAKLHRSGNMMPQLEW